MVFDFDESKALVQMADDFLNDAPLFPTKEESKGRAKFIEANIRSAGSYNTYLR
jgi:hypothetical protein